MSLQTPSEIIDSKRLFTEDDADCIGLIVEDLLYIRNVDEMEPMLWLLTVCKLRELIAEQVRTDEVFKAKIKWILPTNTEAYANNQAAILERTKKVDWLNALLTKLGHLDEDRCIKMMKGVNMAGIRAIFSKKIDWTHKPIYRFQSAENSVGRISSPDAVGNRYFQGSDGCYHCVDQYGNCMENFLYSLADEIKA